MLRSFKLSCFSLLGALVMLSVLSSCAMVQASMCNTNAAYAQGVNDAKNHQDMKTNYASLCSADVDMINASYQKGYTTGLKDQPNSLPQSTYQCQTPYTKEICG